MAPVRIAFDPALPVAASMAFTCKGKRFARGDAFPWRDLGLSAFELRALWTSAFVHFVPATSEAQTFRVAPGEVVTVETPTQQKKRRRRRKRTESQPPAE